ncbi:M23 family metallopeptidase [Leucothrix sargassi]|nr:M23 family metallopeptidase [Leucothrix sargassi]
MTISIAPPRIFAATLVLLSGALISLSALANYSPLEEIKKVGFHGRVHPWKNITRKAHSIKVNVPKNAPIIVSDYHSSVGANGLRRTGFHRGVDMYAPIGSPVIAAADGQVLKAKVDRCWGPTMLVSHGVDKNNRPIYALYGHVRNFKVKPGDKVKRGQQIAEMGNAIYNGCGAGFNHLHFQISYSPKSIPVFGWGWASFVNDGASAPNPHKYWADGEGNVTCFEPGREYAPNGLTYPLPCKNEPQKAPPAVTIVAQNTEAPKPINHPSFEEDVNLDEIEREFLQAAVELGLLEEN